MRPSDGVVEEGLHLLASGVLPASAPLARGKGGGRRKAQVNREIGQIHLATLLEEAKPLRLRHLWEITGLPGGEEAEEVLLGLRPSPFPKGLEGALKAFGQFYPERVVEAAYWGTLASMDGLPERARARALSFASRLLVPSPLLPRERTALYRLRRAYGRGVGTPAPSRVKVKARGAAVAVIYGPNIGEFLRQVRNRFGVTQSEVARRLGLTQERVSFIEKTKGPKMRMITIERYIGALGGRLLLPRPASSEETLRAYFHSLRREGGEASIKVANERGEVVGEYIWAE